MNDQVPTSRGVLWSVVLAGGEGERMRPFVERWLGHHKPKQFCTFAGDRSLLQRTVDRADALGSPSRRVTVVARERLEEARRQLRGRPEGILIPQPKNLGTGPGVLLALARIAAKDRSALVVLYPSDHFVDPEPEFLDAVARAAATAREMPQKLVLLGADPDGAQRDYGWIRRGRLLRDRAATVHEVAAFVEKPSDSESRDLLAGGALWNTMILAGTVDKFWRLGWQHLPELMPLFTFYRDMVGTPWESVVTSWEGAVLHRIYERMPHRNFSKDVLQKAPADLVVTRLEGVLWSDWGRPERVAETLRSIGAKPAFPEAHLRDRSSPAGLCVEAR